MAVIKLMVVAWCLGICTSDLVQRRIPNFMSFGAIVLAGGYLLATGQAALGASWQSALLGGLLGLLLTLPAYLAGQLGAGDVKLLLAMGLLAGWYMTLFAFVFAALIAGVVGVGYMICVHYGGLAVSLKKRMPFGAALSLGFLLAIGVAK